MWSPVPRRRRVVTPGSGRALSEGRGARRRIGFGRARGGVDAIRSELADVESLRGGASRHPGSRKGCSIGPKRSPSVIRFWPSAEEELTQLRSELADVESLAEEAASRHAREQEGLLPIGLEALAERDSVLAEREEELTQLRSELADVESLAEEQRVVTPGSRKGCFPTKCSPSVIRFWPSARRS